ncbi:UDP-N-acetylmuramate--L-alanyl-gamma-D-glutamyl-meso-2,6-diaminoheptandioate ligase [compost metagenome]
MPLEQQLDVGRIVRELNAQGVIADAAPAVETLVERVSSNARPNDLLLVMSNGSFGGFIPSVLERLKTRHET